VLQAFLANVATRRNALLCTARNSLVLSLMTNMMPKDLADNRYFA
jgi:hypothetical protein